MRVFGNSGTGCDLSSGPSGESSAAPAAVTSGIPSESPDIAQSPSG